ncbi:hypothetical protein BH23CHL2_BH23CHL2_16010 [soil metagenome]
MTIATLFLLLNPAVVAAIWAGGDEESRRDASVQTMLIATLAGLVGLAAAVIAGRALLDGLDISDPTFRIAAGVLVIFGAFQAFLGIGLRHPQATASWTAVAHILWLVSPSALAATIAIRINDGVSVGLVVAALAVLAATVPGYLWLRHAGSRYDVLLGWMRRVFAAAAAVGGVDLIRQGVLSI